MLCPGILQRRPTLVHIQGYVQPDRSCNRLPLVVHTYFCHRRLTRLPLQLLDVSPVTSEMERSPDLVCRVVLPGTSRKHKNGVSQKPTPDGVLPVQKPVPPRDVDSVKGFFDCRRPLAVRVVGPGSLPYDPPRKVTGGVQKIVRFCSVLRGFPGLGREEV